MLMADDKQQDGRKPAAFCVCETEKVSIKEIVCVIFCLFTVVYGFESLGGIIRHLVNAGM